MIHYPTFLRSRISHDSSSGRPWFGSRFLLLATVSHRLTSPFFCSWDTFHKANRTSIRTRCPEVRTIKNG